MKAKETVLLFVNKEVKDIYRPTTELREFDKVELDVNETKTVTFKLNKRSFSIYDLASKDFVVEEGEYSIVIAKNAHEAILEEKIILNGVKLNSLRDKTPSFYDLVNFSQNDLQHLIEEKIVITLRSKQEPVTMDSTLKQISEKSYIGNKVVGVMKNIAFEGQDMNDLTTRAFMDGFDNQTFRCIVLGSSGRLTKDLAEKILSMVNGELIDAIKDLKDLLKDFKEMSK
mgnify:CR=1 FL=1